MSLLTSVNLSKSYGAKDVFKGINLSIPQRARIGLVGANGVGKTTLLRVLLGEEQPTQGSIQRAHALRVGYLPQEVVQTSRSTLWQECLQPFDTLIKMQAEITEISEQMNLHTGDAVLLKKYGNLQSKYERLGGYTYETRMRQVMGGLGFYETDYERPLQQFSGGECTRAVLARLLLTEPDLLLMDEPTNHLDLQAIEWLEDYLKDYPGAVVLVSHDRYFLDRVAAAIWKMTPALEIYRGNYSAYLVQREQRHQRRMQAYQTQQKFIDKEEEYIRRNLAGQNARQAKGRLKRLNRLKEDKKLTQPLKSRQWKFHLQSQTRSGDLVLRTYGLSVGYMNSQEALFHVPDLTLIRGECAAILGPNGAGKTTFLKTILNQIPSLAGEVVLGANLQLGYLSQAHEELHLNNTLIDEIGNLAPSMLPAEIRDYLARFLFSGEVVFQEVGTLSGGEQSRLALACLVLQGANLLLLDEPTNHLDLPSQEALQRNLIDYPGTILMVTHDRYLVDAVASQIWEVDGQNRRLNIFAGNYSQYRAMQEKEKENKSLSGKKEKKPKNKSFAPKVNKHKIRLIEQEITRLENELKAVMVQLEEKNNDRADVAKLGSHYVELQQELDEKLQEWDKILNTI